MERPQVESKIAEALNSFKKGSVLFVDDFLDYGNPESIKKGIIKTEGKEYTCSIGARYLPISKN